MPDETEPVEPLSEEEERYWFAMNFLVTHLELAPVHDISPAAYAAWDTQGISALPPEGP